MKREELTSILSTEYRDGLSCGVERVEEPGFENIWFVVPPSPPRQIPAGLPVEAIGRASRLLETLPELDAADELDQMVSYLYIRREAVQSSRVEGTWSTIDHVLTPGELYDSREGRSERASVLGYARALETEVEHFRKNGPAVFSIELVRRLHHEIMSKDPYFKGKPGRIREPGQPGSVVLIGGLRRKEESTYNPTPPRHVARCLRETIEWMGDRDLNELGRAGMGMSLPVRMAIGHAHFEAVHPFSDGNGRIGRILLTLQMAAHGVLPLYLSGYIEKENRAYLNALGQAQKKLRYGEIVEFMCDAVIASRREAEQTRALIRGLPQRWSELASFRENSAARRALPALLTRPIFTVNQLAELLKVSAPAAHRAAAQLVERKIVRERTGYGRNRVFAAEEVIELLSRSFAEDPAIALERARELIEKGAS